MKITVNRRESALRVLFSAAPIVESEELRPGVVIDLGADGAMVGVEIRRPFGDEPVNLEIG